MLRTMLGPWWRWKLTALIVSVAILAAFVFAMAGVIFVVGIVLAPHFSAFPESPT